MQNPDLNTMYYIGIDPSFGTSACGIILCAVLDDKVHVIESRELMLKYHLTRDNIKILSILAVQINKEQLKGWYEFGNTKKIPIHPNQAYALLYFNMIL